ncbi:MAG TPA: hypothetical protein PKA10_20470 [Selenomonadales bacterium]|nr:hypothetical protein [Selenomonadales bacterium]
MPNYEKIAVLDNQFEAELLTALLAERNIPHLVKSYYDAAYDGLFQAQKGWGAVYAEPRHRAEITEALADLRAGSPCGEQE